MNKVILSLLNLMLPVVTARNQCVSNSIASALPLVGLAILLVIVLVAKTMNNIPKPDLKQ
jgi:hypothetical protein